MKLAGVEHFQPNALVVDQVAQGVGRCKRSFALLVFEQQVARVGPALPEDPALGNGIASPGELVEGVPPVRTPRDRQNGGCPR